MENLLQEAKGIQSYLEIECSDNPEEMQERIRALSVHLARSGNMLADAKQYLRRKKTSEIQETIIKIAKEACLSATVQNALLDSICDDEAHLVDFIERMNRTCYHQIDALRSLLSYEKENLSLTKRGY